MTSKVLVKLPTVPFSQGKKSPLELVPMPNRHDANSNQIRQRNIYGDSVVQLEQSMKFLQEQHQATLIALHQEVENLRQRNRDLQFQLVFSKSNISLSSSNPSSPEDSGNGVGFMKSKGSPVSVNSTPLQVELLEKEIHDIKKSLDETKTHNSYLNEIIEQQKKLLEVQKESVKEIGIQVDTGMNRSQSELVSRLQDAEAMVKKLRREYEEQNKEIASLKASLANTNNHPGGSSRGRRNHHHHSRPTTSEGSQDENSYKFPPLQSQSYWHRGSKGNQNYDHGSNHSDYHRNEKNQPKQQERKSFDDGTVLPQLRNSTNKADNNSASYPPFYRSRGYHSGGSYYGGNKKYRFNRSQRRDQDGNGHHQRREYKDREQKHSRQEDYPDSADGTKDCKTTRKP